ncbi:hypothetical protein [Propionimicrobium sp. PCR01-08-3]|uniref:hypothetical protein n=1 Tax=Propionimicrobium sp. PCR01-08-3 TaxID=3052086 RepID=UPI00255C97D2|nr:hypothetical protein [Propionimicrobium sp. PCR01-08-3]WIY83989.1 hypothetical protein QQ658_06535 [Propionimicrobium sp. PCR01-08-3]
MQKATVVDVIETFFGELPPTGAVSSMTDAEFELFGRLVNESGTAHINEDSHAAQELVYPGGFLGPYWNADFVQPAIAGMLLYQPRVLLHDQICDFFDDGSQAWIPSVHQIRYYASNGEYRDIAPSLESWIKQDLYSTYFDQGNIQGAKLAVDHMVQRICEFAPLIRDGTIVLRPQRPIMRNQINSVMASARTDAKSESMLEAAKTATGLTQWDMIQGGKISLSGGSVRTSDIRWQWETEFMYLAKSLAIAHSYGAIYTPTHDPDWKLLQAKISSEPKRYRSFIHSDKRVETLTEVANVSLPSGVFPARTVAKLRANEAAFEDWRSVIRDIVREADAVANEDVPLLVQDRLAPLNRKIVQPISAAVAVNSAIREIPIEAGIYFLTSYAGGSPIASLVSAGAYGVSAWARDMYSRRKNSSSASWVFTRLRDTTASR